MAMLAVNDIHVYYGSIHAVKGVSLEVNEGRSSPSSAPTAPGSPRCSTPSPASSTPGAGP